MFERLVSIDQKFTEQQKIIFGAVGLLAGIGLLALLTIIGISSPLVEVAVGIIGVFTIVLGTLLLGTSDQSNDQTV